MTDFISAGLPWILFAIAMALYFSKIGARKAGDGKGDSGFLTFGLGMGFLTGGLVSFLGLVPLGLGLGMGALLGVLFGSAAGGR